MDGEQSFHNSRDGSGGKGGGGVRGRGCSGFALKSYEYAEHDCFAR